MDKMTAFTSLLKKILRILYKQSVIMKINIEASQKNGKNKKVPGPEEWKAQTTTGRPRSYA